MDPMDVLLLVAVLAILISASISDWRVREVSDVHWQSIGFIGLAFLLASSIIDTGLRWEFIPLALGTSLMLLDLLVSSKLNQYLIYSTIAVLFIVPLLGNLDDPLMLEWASIPLAFILYCAMYYVRLIVGGADLKCLVVLSIAFPTYPDIGFFEQMDPILVFIPSLMILFVACVITMFGAVHNVICNLMNGYGGWGSLMNVKMDVSKARRSFVWPLEDIVDGELKRIRLTNDDLDGIYDRLIDAKVDRVWVTKMIPFIIPLTVATFIVAILGNPFGFIL